MRYFITGATGYIGGALARKLAAQGHQVVIVARRPASAAALAALGIEVHQGDITDKETLRAPMTGADGVFHVAGWYKVGVRDTREAEAINVVGTRHVLEMMRELNIPKGVYTSTIATFSDTHGHVPDESYHYNGAHLSVYDRTKWEAHHQVALPMIKSGLPLVIVLPGVVYGPDDQSAVGVALRDYLRRRPPAALLLPLRTAFAWGYLDDIVDGHILAMEKGRPGEEYIIAGPVHTFDEALTVAQNITGIPKPPLRVPPWMMRLSSALMGVVERIVPVPEAFSSEYLRISAGVTYLGDNAKARRELGYNPRPLPVGLRETLRYEMNKLGLQSKA